jgi:hypothetical protein|tara:strand:- start:568 stop:783 length:216 start_codon:yes stop_codon:yes gene_type:complete
MKNATDDANKSFDQKLIDIISRQHDIIFSTRKRLFEAEKMQKLSFFLIGLLTLSILLLAVNDVLIKGVING